MTSLPRIRRDYPVWMTPFLCLLVAMLFPVPHGLLQIPDTLHRHASGIFSSLRRHCAPDRHQSQVPVSVTERVLTRLEKAEQKESDPWLRDDLKIAWLTVRWAQNGVPEWSWYRDSPPYVAATYQVLHCRPEQVWPKIVAWRKANLGREYSLWYDANDNLRSQDPTREAASLMGIHATPKACSGGDADTDSITGRRVESGETGVCTASGSLSPTMNGPENSHDGSSPAKKPSASTRHERKKVA